MQGLKRRSPYQNMDAHGVRSSLLAAVGFGLGAAALRGSNGDRSLAVLFAAGAIALTGKAALAAFYEG